MLSHYLFGKHMAFDGEAQRFLLANRKGSYLMLASSDPSRYDGFFMLNNQRMFKFVENISTGSRVRQLTNHFHLVERQTDDGVERFFLPSGLNSVVYEKQGAVPAILDIDCRESYDSRSWGRSYVVEQKKGMTIISFTKCTDFREDQSTGQEEYKLFIAVSSPGCETIGTWVRKEYPFDRSRNSNPSDRYVYSAIRINSPFTVITASTSEEEARSECQFVLQNHKSLLYRQKRLVSESTPAQDKLPDKILIARQAAMHSLDSLGVENGLLAGLPWFFQPWTRDQLISLGALQIMGRYKQCKSIFTSLIGSAKNGEVPSIVGGGAHAADSLGWMILRWLEFSQDPDCPLSTKDIQKHTESLEWTMNLFSKNRTRDGLICCDRGETWMDSISREGFALEIQALHLASLQRMLQLTGKKLYGEKEAELRDNVRKKFWNGLFLADTAAEVIIRPNIFLAAYVYPQLLSDEEWRTCLKSAIDALWNDWGGFSTIDKANPAYQPNHTGENSLSYHNGDSWYWINNLAAIVLHRVDKKLFKTHINRILDASAQEILFSGAIGHHAELSSSSKQESAGCLAQAWSNAMFIELVDEISKDTK